ncbi:long-chain fatty acid--CoA ligase [Streptacidiphilus sp. 4-A2]|nr:long-chain fatty acid--CoA ligase [Streptacidiphilus sp. 4-A2]
MLPAASRLDTLILESCAEHADRIALIDDSGHVTYGDLAARARQICEELRLAGHRRGEPVLVAVDNQHGDMACQLAAWAAGGTVVPIHRGVPAPQLAEVMGRTGSAWLLCEPSLLPAQWAGIPREARGRGCTDSRCRGSHLRNSAPTRPWSSSRRVRRELPRELSCLTRHSPRSSRPSTACSLSPPAKRICTSCMRTSASGNGPPC